MKHRKAAAALRSPKGRAAMGVAALAVGMGAGGQCTEEQVVLTGIASAFTDGDFSHPLYHEAVAVARCESSLNPRAINRNGCGGAGCYGLFQHHATYAPARFSAVGFNFYEDWDNPYANAKAAKYLYNQAGGWGPWECKP